MKAEEDFLYSFEDTYNYKKTFTERLTTICSAVDFAITLVTSYIIKKSIW